MAWYVVYQGRQPGVYDSWHACHAQVNGFKNCCYKSFATKEMAIADYLEYMHFAQMGVEKKIPPKEPPRVVSTTNWLRHFAIAQTCVLFCLIIYLLNHSTKCY